MFGLQLVYATYTILLFPRRSCRQSLCNHPQESRYAAKINELRRLEGTLLEGVQQPFRSTVLSQRRKIMRDVKIKNLPP